jgi:acylphosphatase
MIDEPYSRIHATVTGRVQGVSFRYYVLDQAEKLDLLGWVRNRWNGSVEVTAEGSRQNLELLLHRLRSGPPMATVTDVDFEWLSKTGEFVDFQIKKTA